MNSSAAGAATLREVEDDIVLAPHLSSAGKARRFVRQVLAAQGLESDSLELVTSELVGNVVAHAHSEVRLTVRVGARIRIEVADGDAIIPAVVDAASDAESGRGLFIVEAVSSAWGVDTVADGKRVWAELDRP